MTPQNEPDDRDEVELHPFDFGLERGDILRTQRAPGCKWHEFLLRGVNRDGSFELIDRKTGGVRSMLPSTHPFQVKRRGARGATVWLPIEEAAQHVDRAS